MTGDEDFVKRAREWKLDAGAQGRARAAAAAESLSKKTNRTSCNRFTNSKH
jgi:hypothetical protein